MVPQTQVQKAFATLSLSPNGQPIKLNGDWASRIAMADDSAWAEAIRINNIKNTKPKYE